MSRRDEEDENIRVIGEDDHCKDGAEDEERNGSRERSKRTIFNVRTGNEWMKRREGGVAGSRGRRDWMKFRKSLREEGLMRN